MSILDRIGMALALAASVAFCQIAFAHASLKRASPAPGTTVQVAPTEIVLSFSEPVEEAFSTVTVKDASGKSMSSAKVRIDATDGATVHLDVPKLPSGLYTVQWVAVSHDSHRRTGVFSFTVK